MRRIATQIRVNAVNPTVVMTAMGKKAWSDPGKAAGMLSRIPLGRFVGKRSIAILISLCSECPLFVSAEEEEVVKPILFLLSEQSSMINCATMSIDGGFTAC